MLHRISGRADATAHRLTSDKGMEMRRTSLCVVVLAAATLMAPTAASAASWAAQSPVDPAGSTASELAGTACTSSSDCLAVGRYDPGSGTLEALIEQWNGTSWSQQTAATPPVGATGSGLVGIGCTSSSACTAVGSYTDASFEQWALVERWDGTSWALQTLPRPAGSTGSNLAGVACTSSSSCLAVGSYLDATSVSQPLAASWDGSSWTLQSVPTVAGATGTGLSALSCASGTACTAVGSYLDATGTPLPSAASWDGSRWALQSVPTPRGAASTFLSGVSCTSATACTAVGYSTDRLGAVFAVAERLSGTTWSEQSLASPPAGSAGTALVGVSCTSSTHCSGVGYSYDALGTLTTLAEGWDGSTWSLQTTPNPVGHLGASLNGISCTSSTLCTSVGYFYDGLSVQRTLAQRYS
jgi:hypothetical protein